MPAKILAAILTTLTLSGCVAVVPVERPPGALGYQCIAGVYQCRLTEQVPAGSPCSCPGIGAPSYGTVR